MSRSLRVRLSVLVLAVASAGMAILCVSLFFAARHVWHDSFDEALEREALPLAHTVEEHRGRHFTFEYAGVATFEDPHRPAYFEFWRPDGEVLARSRFLGTGDLPRRPAKGDGPVLFSGRLPDGRRGRFFQLVMPARWDDRGPVPPVSTRPRVTMVMGRGTEELDLPLARLRVWLAGLGALLVALISTAAGFSVWRGLRPATELARAIAAIDERHLGQRLASTSLPLELEPMVTKMNELFARLEESFARERRFTADVSHELRTPLAGLRSILEVTASRPRAVDDYARSLADAAKITRDMQTMTENLLLLARIDERRFEVQPRAIALREFVETCWLPYADRAQSRQLAFRNEISAEATLWSDPDHLRMVVTNLLANAAEYTALGGFIVVTADPTARIILEVRDSGPPIPAQALPRIFERMFRVDAARTAGAHCGIGLALVRMVSTALGLDVTARNLPDGSVSFALHGAPVRVTGR